MTTSSTTALDPASTFLDDSDLAVTFSAPSLDDQPLVYVNGAFCRLVGYGREECTGRNCRFLQGEDTDPAAVARVRDGIRARSYRFTPLINYRRDGEAFRNGLLIGPVGGDDRRDELLFGMQWDIDRTLAWRAGIDAHGWKDPDSDAPVDRFERLVSRVVRASYRHDASTRFTAVVERLVAISRLNQYPSHGRLPNWTRADALLTHLAEPYRDEVAEGLSIEGDAEVLAIDAAHPLALAVHELSFATRRQARRSGTPPRIALSCDLVPAGGEPALELVWRTEHVDPPNVDGEASRATRAGLAIVSDVADLLGGRFDAEVDGRGIEAVLRVPNRVHDAADGEQAP